MTGLRGARKGQENVQCETDILGSGADAAGAYPRRTLQHEIIRSACTAYTTHGTDFGTVQVCFRDASSAIESCG